MARSTIHYGRKLGKPEEQFCGGKIVNAYVRLGNPTKWYVTGQVCTACGLFKFDSRVPPDQRR